jgi:hypothetical protein
LIVFWCCLLLLLLFSALIVARPRVLAQPAIAEEASSTARALVVEDAKFQEVLKQMIGVLVGRFGDIGKGKVEELGHAVDSLSEVRCIPRKYPQAVCC